LTEFLPVSSSGHLVFFQSLFGMRESQLFFDVMLHLGTLLTVVVYFRADIWKIVQAIATMLRGKRESQREAKLLLWTIVATIPTGLMGILFRDWFESLFPKPKIVGVMLLITGLVLYLTRWTKREGRKIEKMGWVDSILIGIAQGLAIIPGISRSGATISTGLFLWPGSGTLSKVFLSPLHPCNPGCNLPGVSKNWARRRGLDRSHRDDDCFSCWPFFLDLFGKND
jgi:undecaprenyl-diphosphatase